MKKFNKITLLLTICIISVALVLILVACNDSSDGDGGNNHTHRWADWSLSQAPTQDAAGSASRACLEDGCDLPNQSQSVEIPALSSQSYNVNDTATCGAAGSKSYSISIDGYGSISFSVPSLATGNHSIVSKSGVAATCSAHGAEAYYECSVCLKKFSDEDGENEIDAPVPTDINPNNHNRDSVKSHIRVEASCIADGMEAYWECEDCHKRYSEPTWTTEIDEPVVISANPDVHNLVPHGAVDATCKADGNIAYYECEDCHKLYSDANGSVEISEAATVISKSTVQHSGVYNAPSAGCTWDGHEEYWECSVCDKLFSDEACSVEIDEPAFMAASHKLVEVAASQTSEKKIITNAGGFSLTMNNTLYYQCSVCGKKYKSDAADANEITSAVQGGGSANGGNLIGYGENKVQNTLRFGFFQADSDGKYTFEINADYSRISYMSNDESAFTDVYYPSWNTSVTAYENFEIEDASVLNKVTVNMKKGDCIRLGFASSYYIVNVDREHILNYGDSSIFIKSDDMFDANDYVFVAEQAKYSIVIPADLYVELNGEELVDSVGGTFNFKCEVGQEIVFSFYGSEIKSYIVTIGEPVVLKAGVSTVLSVNNSGEVNSGKPMTSIEIDDSVAEGRYTLTITSSANLIRSQSTFLFAKNSSDSLAQLTGTQWNDGTADVMLSTGSMMAKVLDEDDTDSVFETSWSAGTWTITLNLKAGDVLTFLTSYVSQSTYPLTIILTAVA